MKRSIGSLFLILCACKGGQQDCTMEAVGSVNLVVVDGAGNPITGATAVYGLDGGAVDQPCEEMVGGSYVCGWELAGAFEVAVSKEGYAVATGSATVEEDVCHVIPQTLELTLAADPVDCPAVETYAVVLTVTDGQGEDVTSGTVTWAYDLDGAEASACEHAGGNQWNCGLDVVGALNLSITDAGPYEVWSQGVTVLGDDCGPVTQEISAVLQYLPD